MSKRGVFTAIPYIPGETKAERYEGMPLSAEESVFSIHDIIKKYGNSSDTFLTFYESFVEREKNSSKQAAAMRVAATKRMCRYFENSRGSAENFFGFFREVRGFIAAEVADVSDEYLLYAAIDSQDDILRFELEVVNALAKRQQGETDLRLELTNELAVELFELAFAIKGKKSGHDVEMFLANLLNDKVGKEIHPEVAVPIFYAMALHALESGDDEKIKYMAEIMLGQTDIAHAHSMPYKSVIAGNYYKVEDEKLSNLIRRQANGLTEFREFLCRAVLSEEMLNGAELEYLNIVTMNDMVTFIKNNLSAVEISERNVLAAALAEGELTQILLDSNTISAGARKIFEDITLKQTLLILRINEYINDVSGGEDDERMAFIHLLGMGAFFLIPERVQDFHLSMQNLLRRSVKIPSSEVFTPENSMKYLTTLAKYNRPEQISAEGVEKIIKLNQEYKEGMFLGLQPKKQRSIPKKGVRINITDPDLKEFGYKSMTFKPGDNGYTYCQFKVGEYAFVFYIDDKGNMQDLPDCDDVSKKIMETIVLAHLDEFMCVTKESLRPGMSTAEFKDFENAYASTREPFRRNLSPRYVPRLKQMQLAQDDSDWNHLPAYNVGIISSVLSDYEPDIASIGIESALNLARKHKDVFVQQGISLATYVSRYDVKARTPDNGQPLRFTSHVTQKDIYGSE